MTMDFVQELLIHHEQKLKFKETMTDAGTSGSVLLGQWRKGSPVCWSCNELERFCPKK